MNDSLAIAAKIVEAEMSDDWLFADLLRPRLREANRARRSKGLKSIRATQAWYLPSSPAEQRDRETGRLS